MAAESAFITRTILRETAEEWGLPSEHTMARHPVCVVCGHGAMWVDCPTGGWWSHWMHPDDDHDAEMDGEFDQSRASIVTAEYMGSGRWTEKWAVTFRAPDDGGYWVAYYEEPSHENGEGMDPWDDEPEIKLTATNPKVVKRVSWVLTPRPIVTP